MINLFPWLCWRPLQLTEGDGLQVEVQHNVKVNDLQNCGPRVAMKVQQEGR